MSEEKRGKEQGK